MSELTDWVARVERERDEARAEVERLRASPLAVCVVDVEAAAKAWLTPGQKRADDLAAHFEEFTRAADPEALARAIREESDAWMVAGAANNRFDGAARAALAHLGIALAEPTGPRTVTGNEPWTDQDRKHGRHFVAPGAAGFQGPDHERHWLAEKPDGGWRAGLEALISQIEAWRAPPHVLPKDILAGHDDAISAARKLIRERALAEKPAAPAPGKFVLDVARVLAAYDAPSSIRKGLRSAVEEIARQLGAKEPQ